MGMLSLEQSQKDILKQKIALKHFRHWFQTQIALDTPQCPNYAKDFPIPPIKLKEQKAT